MHATLSRRMALACVCFFLASPTMRGAEPLPVASTQNRQELPVAPPAALARITVPEGFRVTLFAGEPDVRQPIAFTFDDRGRLWVVECYSYPDYEHEKSDRVLIFSDRDGDGRFDERKVFWDQGTRLTGIEVGFGGVWLCSAPQLIFLSDADQDDRPDGPPQVLLDGWNVWEVHHNIVNGLTWGLDGWLYGRHGIMGESRVGKPGTPDEQRTVMNCGIWRYHPTQQRFEVVAHGTTNPWGLDYNDHGEAFFTNNVIGHLWHLVPGAHYQRMHGDDYNRHLYDLMEATSDHLHWAGEKWYLSREGQGEHGELGGGHSHSGAMIYLGGNWPEKYRDTIFMSNTHGNRLNHDLLRRHRSGYVGRHAPDFMRANDPAFRGVELKYGPDGGVYVTDWNDLGECHDHDGAARETGRIYKIVYGQPQPAKAFDLARRSDLELVEFQRHPNDWYVRHARRLLQERAAAGHNVDAAAAALEDMLRSHPETPRRLRALWALYSMGRMSEARLASLLNEPDEHLRAWAVRLLCDTSAPTTAVLQQLASLSHSEPGGLVRLYLASALQRLPLDARAGVAQGLVTRSEDATDHNLTLMIWYGIEPLVASDLAAARQLARRAQNPRLRQFIARRVTLAQAETGVAENAVVSWLAESDDAAVQRDLLRGMHDALRGRREQPMPPGFDDLYERLAASSDESVRETVLALGVIYGDRRAIEYHRQRMLDTDAPAAARRESLQTLLEKRVPDLAPLLHALLADRAVRGAALRALGAYESSDTPRIILQHYPRLEATEKRVALATLASRGPYAEALLAAVAEGTVPSADLSPVEVRQIYSLGSAELNQQLERLWGRVRQSSQEKQKLIGDYKQLLQPAYLEQARASQGRAVFNRVCASCHTLFGEGNKIGPDLTGSNRANLHYVLENVIDPSATVARGYQVATVITVDGRVLSGMVSDETDQTLAIQTATERVVLDRDDVEARKPSELSMMPEGLFEKLADEEIRDLVAYLASPRQVPLPEGGVEPALAE